VTLLDNWEQQLWPQGGRLGQKFGNNNYRREAAAFLNWATIGNNNYGREAAAFLKAKYWFYFGQLETLTRAAKRPPSGIGQQLGTTTAGAKRPPF
jgi:hypothetical protein